MLLFRKLVDETQMSTTPETTSYHSSKKFSILLPLGAIQNLSFHYETPCMYYFGLDIWYLLFDKFSHTDEACNSFDSSPKFNLSIQ